LLLFVTGIIDEVIQTKKSNLPKPARPVLV
jgi:hypothetical protein